MVILRLIPQLVGTTGPAPICLRCARFDRDADNLACEAFPEKIPNDIIMNGADHRSPVQGDQGLLFDPVDDKAVEYANRILGEIPT